MGLPSQELWDMFHHPSLGKDFRNGGAQVTMQMVSILITLGSVIFPEPVAWKYTWRGGKLQFLHGATEGTVSALAGTGRRIYVHQLQAPQEREERIYSSFTDNYI